MSAAKNRKCAFCKGEIHRHEFALYCSPKCKEDMKLHLRRIRKAKQTRTFNCAYCGKEKCVPEANTAQKYCSRQCKERDVTRQRKHEAQVRKQKWPTMNSIELLAYARQWRSEPIPILVVTFK